MIIGGTPDQEQLTDYKYFFIGGDRPQSTENEIMWLKGAQALQ